MRVLDVYGGLPVATQVIEQFNLFGDASLQVRTRTAGLFAVEAPALVAAADAGFTATWTARGRRGGRLPGHGPLRAGHRGVVRRAG